MKDAKYRWVHDGHEYWYVEKKVPGFLGFGHCWEYVSGSTRITKDTIVGRKACEAIIEEAAASSNGKRVTFYYDEAGRQLPGFDLE